MKTVNYTYSGHVIEELRSLAQRACDSHEDPEAAQEWFDENAGQATGAETFCFTVFERSKSD